MSHNSCVWNQISKQAPHMLDIGTNLNDKCLKVFLLELKDLILLITNNKP